MAQCGVRRRRWTSRKRSTLASDAAGQRNGQHADVGRGFPRNNVVRLKPSPDPYTRRVIIAVALGAFAFVLWQLRAVLPLLFGGVILATGLRALSEAVARATPLPQRVALVGVVVALLAMIGLGVWLVGGQVAGQLTGLWRTLPQALGAAS